jgi:uncharacterized membrane protein YedE/YeeE
MATGTEPLPADSASPDPDASSRTSKRSSDAGPRTAALIVGVLVGLGIGLGVGMSIGNAARKRIDRLSPRY